MRKNRRGGLRQPTGLFFQTGNRRRRAGRLTAVGRWALVLIVLSALGLGWAVSSVGAKWRAGNDRPIPDVSAAPPPAVVAGSWIDDPPASFDRFSVARQQADVIDPSSVPRLVEWLDPVDADFLRRHGRAPSLASASDAVRVEYSLDEALTAEIFEIFRRGRVDRGQAIVLDPRNGRLLSYVSTDPTRLPPDGTYPVASIVKLLTAATLLEEAPSAAARPCVYRGNKYRLGWRRLARPSSGHETTLARALASSNNQCFAHWAVHDLGAERVRGTFERFGWLAPPAPGHAAGQMDEIRSKLDLGRLGSGLDGVRVNPLHVASLASILTEGRLIEPWWVDRVVDSSGRSLALPDRAPTRQVLSRDVADELRSMMVGTTTMGTAKSAFRTRRGRDVLGGIEVAAKTGNVTGSEPFGRYEWFLGLAPAREPKIAVVVLQLQSNLWWSRSTDLAAKVLRKVFCDEAGCRGSLADLLTGDLSGMTDPRLISELERPFVVSRAD